MGRRKCGSGSRWLAVSLGGVMLGISPAGAIAEDEASTPEARKARALERFDKDGDGELGPSEKRAVKKAWRAKQKKRWDTDGDGKLSREERIAGRKARQEGRARKKAAAASEASE